MKKPHYGWVICFACTLLLFITLGLISNIFSVYRPYIIAENGFSNTECAAISTIRCGLSFLSLLFINPFYKKLNIRLGTLIAVMLCALAYGIYGIAGNSLALYYLGAAISGLGYGLGTMVPISLLVHRWFAHRRGLVLGICSMGSGLASILFPPVVTALIESTSLSAAFLLEAAFMVAAGLLIFLLLRNTPEEKGLSAYTSVKAQRSQGHTAPKAEQSPLSAGQWVWVGACIILYSAVSSAGNSSMALLFTTEGYDSMTVAYALSLFGIILSGSKFAYGILADKIGTYANNYLYGGCVLAGTVLSCFAYTRHPAVLFFSTALLGIGLPTSTVGYSLWAADFSNSATYPSAIARIQTLHSVGALIFESFPGILADLFGSYIPAYVIFSAFTLLSMGGIQLLYLRRAKQAH